MKASTSPSRRRRRLPGLPRRRGHLRQGRLRHSPEPWTCWPRPNRSVRRHARIGGKCHFDGGGGNGVEHGDLDESLYFPSENLDVHMGKLIISCAPTATERRISRRPGQIAGGQLHHQPRRASRLRRIAITEPSIATSASACTPTASPARPATCPCHGAQGSERKPSGTGPLPGQACRQDPLPPI